MSLVRGRRSDYENSNSSHRVRCQQQRERFDKVYDLDLQFMDEFVNLCNSLIVPQLDSIVLTACRNQTKMVRICTTNDVFLMTVGLGSFD